MTLKITTSPERDVEVRPSPIHGMGVFARSAFEPGEIVLRWDISRLITKEECALLSERERLYTHPFDEERMIVIQPPERFVNHSCNNNTVVRNFCDVAIQSIAPGEEITSDYSTDGSGSQFVCSCGFENCRGKLK